MAFVVDQLRVPHSMFCSCDRMTREERVRLTVSDCTFFMLMQRRIPHALPGILFKYPDGWTPSGPHEPESLRYASFKILSILAENAARYFSSQDAEGFIFDWHYRHFLELKQIFITHFHFPPTIADAVLPRIHDLELFPYLYEDICQQQLKNVTYRHHCSDYEKYYRLRIVTTL